MKDLVVNAQWDEDAGVWVATSEDIPGLVTEAATLDDLVKRVAAVAPELLEANAHLLEEAGRPGAALDMRIVSRFRLDGAHAH